MMRPGESFVSQPIRSLQTMLRTLAEHDDRYQSVVPDGVYSPQTRSAVAQFQQNHGLPVTGITDQRTWEAIVERYEPALVFVDEAQSVEVILNPNEVLRFGDSSPYLNVAQAMLIVLSQVYGSIGLPVVSGILDAATADSLASFQTLTGLPVTGELDKRTWKHLALHFPLAANLGRGQTQAESRR
ncbi:MAG: peptidoglycan-binding protein [Oscillospiraceae bacterium]|nr:peptidoglycan-binding protein [Oscillospiraceae bacterium]